MRWSRRIALALAACASFAASLGSADIPPPPDSPDAHCSREEQCAHGVECPAGLRVDHDASAACVSGATARGLSYRCHTGGNYGGTSLYCPAGETGSWTPPKGSPQPPATSPAPTGASSSSASPGDGPAPAPAAAPRRGLCSVAAPGL